MMIIIITKNWQITPPFWLWYDKRTNFAHTNFLSRCCTRLWPQYAKRRKGSSLPRAFLSVWVASEATHIVFSFFEAAVNWNMVGSGAERTDGRTDKRRVHFSLEMWHLVAVILIIFLIINWPNFVYLLIDPGFLFPPSKWSIAVHPPMGWTLLTDTTDKETCLFVRTPVLSFVS